MWRGWQESLSPAPGPPASSRPAKAQQALQVNPVLSSNCSSMFYSTSESTLLETRIAVSAFSARQSDNSHERVALEGHAQSSEHSLRRL